MLASKSAHSTRGNFPLLSWRARNPIAENTSVNAGRQSIANKLDRPERPDGSAISA